MLAYGCHVNYPLITEKQTEANIPVLDSKPFCFIIWFSASCIVIVIPSHMKQFAVNSYICLYLKFQLSVHFNFQSFPDL